MNTSTMATNSICEPHWERRRMRVPADPEAAHLGMCRACFTGKPLKPLRGLFVLAEETAEAGATMSNGGTEEIANPFLESFDGRPRANRLLLTERNKQMIQLVAQGHRNKEIAEKMLITEQTVKHTLTTIFRKTGVSDRSELTLHAIDQGLVARVHEPHESPAAMC